MEFVGIVVVIALLEYFFFSAMTGKARGASGIQAPAMTGDENFERHYRVQANTIEALVIFLPAIYLFATYVHALTAALLGLVFVTGRALYFKSYVSSPDKRGPGMIMTVLANMIMLLGGLVGIILHLL